MPASPNKSPAAGITAILANAQQIAPAIANLPIVDTWAGYDRVPLTICLYSVLVMKLAGCFMQRGTIETESYSRPSLESYCRSGH
jgi:hypothetical protein